jgi:hypothetical protein
MTSVPVVDPISTLKDNITTLKNFQNIFKNNHENFIPNPNYASPELFTSPQEWQAEYAAFGQKSRLEKLMNQTGERQEFEFIFNFIKSSDDPNIIWEIEQIYKSNSSNEWDLFFFSAVFSMIAFKLETIGITKWKEAHKAGWSRPYEPI